MESSQIPKAVSTYNKLRIVTVQMNNTYCCIYYPVVNSVVGAMTIEAIFMTVKFIDLDNLFIRGFGIVAIVTGGLFLVLVTAFTASVNETALQFHKFLRQSVLIVNVNKVMHKIFRSVRVESLKCGEYYEIRKVTCLTLLGIVTNVAGSLLISIKI